jgi:hypothetical protein
MSATLTVADAEQDWRVAMDIAALQYERAITKAAVARINAEQYALNRLNTARAQLASQSAMRRAQYRALRNLPTRDLVGMLDSQRFKMSRYAAPLGGTVTRDCARWRAAAIVTILKSRGYAIPADSYADADPYGVTS